MLPENISLLLASEDEKSDLLTWLLIDIEIQTSKACHRGFIPAWEVLQNSLTGSNPVLSESNDMLWALIFLFLLTFQRRLWSPDAFCNMVKTTIHLKLCFPWKNNLPGQYCCILALFDPNFLLSWGEIRNQISYISLTRDLIWQLFN